MQPNVSDNAGDFFQSDADIAIVARREQKARESKDAGSPFVLPSKILDMAVVPPRSPNDDHFAYVAESGHVARKLNLTKKTKLQSFMGHKGPVTSVIVICDSNGLDTFIVTGSWDKTAKKWDAKTQGCLVTFSGHGDFVKALALTSNPKLSSSPDAPSSFLLTGSADSTIRQWNPETGACIRVLKGHSRSVESLVVDSSTLDRPILYSSSSDTAIRKWDAVTGELLAVLEGHLTSVYRLLLADGQLWSASADNTVKRWDLDTDTADSTLTHPDFAKSVAVSIEGTYVFTGSRDENVRVWDIASEKCIGMFEGHFNEVSSLQIIGGILYSGSLDGTIRRWEISDIQSTLKKLTDEKAKTAKEEEGGREAKKKGGKGASLMTEEEERELAELLGEDD
ncbi:WD40-repeat-containing domain protein [Cladochytrium replicatum]|nr:WD40-repeat-containing domain protein [Cladochytrium replicatum]